MNNKEATIVTFYSYKGGVGRSMALANIAWLLAESGRKVLVVDWDLEAPGLHRFFGMKDEDISRGLIELLNDYKELLRKESVSLPEKLFDLGKYVQAVEPFSDGGKVSILAAGRQDGKYASRINAFSWEEFYSTWHGFGFIEHLKQQLKTFDETDIVLVDSRTGVTDIGGICTLQLPDVVVILFAMNDQNIAGVKSVAERISKKAGELEGRDAPPILILRPARVERSSGNQDKKIEWQGKAARQLGEYFTDRDAETVIAKKNIPYVSDFSYGEIPLAVVKDPLGDMTDSFKDLATSIMEIADRGNEEGRAFETHQSRARFLRIRARVFLSKRQNVYLLIVFFLLVALAFSFIKIRDLTRTSQALQQQKDQAQADLSLQRKDVEMLLQQIAGGQAKPNASPTPSNGGEITIQIADESQRVKANELATALSGTGFSVSDDIELIQTEHDLTPQTWVKFFYPEDRKAAEHILGIVREKTGVPSSDSRTAFAYRTSANEQPGHFEIWIKKGAF